MADTGPVTATDAAADLLFYLQSAREALLWKLEGLPERDLRWPATPTGTNLLGLVKHATAVELGYLGAAFGRPPARVLPWLDHDAEPDAHLWATADESPSAVVEQYRQAWAHSDETVRTVALDTVGHVPWWPAGDDDVTLHHALTRVVADTQRHAGHADVIRELLDGAVGMHAENPGLPLRDRAGWEQHRARLVAIARRSAGTR